MPGPRAAGPGPTLRAERSALAALAALRLPTDMSCKGLRALAMHLLLKRREPKVLKLQPHLSVGDLMLVRDPLEALRRAVPAVLWGKLLATVGA